MTCKPVNVSPMPTEPNWPIDVSQQRELNFLLGLQVDADRSSQPRSNPDSHRDRAVPDVPDVQPLHSVQVVPDSLPDFHVSRILKMWTGSSNISRRRRNRHFLPGHVWDITHRYQRKVCTKRSSCSIATLCSSLTAVQSSRYKVQGKCKSIETSKSQKVRDRCRYLHSLLRPRNAWVYLSSSNIL